MSRRWDRAGEGAGKEGPRQEQGDLLAGVDHGEGAPRAGREPEGEDDDESVEAKGVAGSSVPDEPPAPPSAAAPRAEVPNAHETSPAAPTPPEGPEVPEGAPSSRRKGVLFELVPSDGTEAVPRPAGERLSRAKELVRAGRADEAIAVYRQILDENPGNLKARNNLGVLYDELGHHVLALEQFEAAEKLGPENVEVLTNLGATLGLVARYEAADEALRRAIRLEPDNIHVRAALGILHYRRGVYVQAEADLRWVCDQDGDYAEAFYYRGEALNRLGRFDEALETLERAIVLQPTNARAFYTLGHLYDRKHLPEEAALMYRKARELQSR